MLLLKYWVGLIAPIEAESTVRPVYWVCAVPAAYSGNTVECKRMTSFKK